MTVAAHEVVVVPANGLHHLGYYSPTGHKFYVIEPFTNGGLAQAAAYLMNQEREN